MFNSITFVRPAMPIDCIAIGTGSLFLDVYPNAVMAFSFRKLRTAYAGSAVRIRRSSDNAEQDIGFSGNDFDAAGAAAFIGGGSGFLTKWYDQSGNAYNAAQSTTALQPLYVASGIGSKPCLYYQGDAGHNNLITGTDAVAFNSSVLSAFAVGVLEADAFDVGRFISLLAHGQTQDFNNTASAPVILQDFNNPIIGNYNNGAILDTKALAFGVASSLSSIFDGATAKVYVNAASGSGAACSNTLGDAGGVTISLGTSPDGEFWQGQCSEVVMYAADKTSNVAAIYANHSAYYGV